MRNHIHAYRWQNGPTSNQQTNLLEWSIPWRIATIVEFIVQRRWRERRKTIFPMTFLRTRYSPLVVFIAGYWNCDVNNLLLKEIINQPTVFFSQKPKICKEKNRRRGKSLRSHPSETTRSELKSQKSPFISVRQSCPDWPTESVNQQIVAKSVDKATLDIVSISV